MERRVGRGHQTVKSLPRSKQFRRGQKGEWGKKRKWENSEQLDYI